LVTDTRDLLAHRGERGRRADDGAAVIGAVTEHDEGL
jgi:hypothetical protein